MTKPLVLDTPDERLDFAIPLIRLPLPKVKKATIDIIVWPLQLPTMG
jgi:hypothetical protein